MKQLEESIKKTFVKIGFKKTSESEEESEVKNQKRQGNGENN